MVDRELGCRRSMGSRSGAFIVFACLVMGAFAISPAHAQGGEPVVAFDIPAQPLGTALNTLAVQANLQIFFEQKPVEGLQALPLAGSMTTREALETLLANTDLTFSQNPDGTLVVNSKLPAPTTPPRRRRPPPKAAVAAVEESQPTVAPPTMMEVDTPWLIRLRATYWDPRNASAGFQIPGTPPSIIPPDAAGTNAKWAPELDGEYFVTPHWSTEMALNLPRVHELYLRGAGFAGSNGSGGDFRAMTDFLTVKYGFLPEGRVRPYVGVGLNVTTYYGVHAGPVTLSSATVGPAAQLGFDLRLTDRWFVNLDAKWAYARPAIDYGGGILERMKLDPMVYGIGIAYRFGKQVAVPAAAAATPVPVASPPADIDSDGDGVPDKLDQCPHTPHGVSVDAKGCPLDSDRDGVPDYEDQCPGTPLGLKVDANGCEVEELVLTGVTFKTDSAILSHESSVVLDKVAAVLKLRPQARAEIHGFTDSRGNDAHNQKLSERRAASVMAYLVGGGVPASELTSKGFGKANPVASNQTSEGRALNRRVTVAFSKPVPRQ